MTLEGGPPCTLVGGPSTLVTSLFHSYVKGKEGFQNPSALRIKIPLISLIVF